MHHLEYPLLELQCHSVALTSDKRSINIESYSMLLKIDQIQGFTKPTVFQQTLILDSTFLLPHFISKQFTDERLPFAQNRCTVKQKDQLALTHGLYQVQVLLKGQKINLHFINQQLANEAVVLLKTAIEYQMLYEQTPKLKTTKLKTKAVNHSNTKPTSATGIDPSAQGHADTLDTKPAISKTPSL